MRVSLQHCSCRESQSVCIVGLSGAGGELLLLQRLTGESSFSGNYEVEMFLGIGDLGDRLPQDLGRNDPFVDYASHGPRERSEQ